MVRSTIVMLCYMRLRRESESNSILNTSLYKALRHEMKWRRAFAILYNFVICDGEKKVNRSQLSHSG